MTMYEGYEFERKFQAVLNELQGLCDTYNVTIHGNYEIVEGGDFDDWTQRRVSSGFAYKPNK